MSDPRIREPYFRFSEPTSWPRGVECVLDYDGYVLNDRRRLDTITIESIGGLTGPDLAAEAEKNPDRDGETPYDATYGGWTITLRGYVDAGTLETMRSLYSYVLDAFDDVSEERPLWFRWLDWCDYFVDSLALVDYAYDSGSGTLQIATDGSGLQPTSTSAKSVVLRPVTVDGSTISRYTYGDGEAIVRFKSSVLTGLTVGPQFRRTSASQKLGVLYEQAASSLTLYKIVGGVTTVLDTSPVAALTAGSSYWLRARIEGAIITYSLWSTYPPDVGGTPLTSDSYTLTAGEQVVFPASTSGLSWGLSLQPAATSDRVEMLDVGAINKGDAIFMCRKAAQSEGDETQVDGRYRRTFAVALRNSSARMVSRKPTTIVSYPSGFSLTFPDDGSGLTFPDDGSGLVFGTYLSQSIVNLGRSPCSPIIRFHGPLTNPALTNPADQGKIAANGFIGLGDYYEFDNARRVVIDSNGFSVERFVNANTSWIDLASGTNSLVFGADGISNVVSDFTATVVAATDVFTLSSHGLLSGQQVVVEPIGVVNPLPTGRSVMYVRDVTTNTFKITQTVGGSALDITSNGSVLFYHNLGRIELIYRHSSR